MIVIDILIVVFVVALLVVGGPAVATRLLRMDPKRKEIEAATSHDEMGEVNTVRHNLTELRRCRVCNELTDPAQDLRAAGSWVHYTCYIEPENKKD